MHQKCLKKKRPCCFFGFQTKFCGSRIKLQPEPKQLLVEQCIKTMLLLLFVCENYNMFLVENIFFYVLYFILNSGKQLNICFNLTREEMFLLFCTKTKKGKEWCIWIKQKHYCTPTFSNKRTIRQWKGLKSCSRHTGKSHILRNDQPVAIHTTFNAIFAGLNKDCFDNLVACTKT